MEWMGGVAHHLRELYKLRLIADYMGSQVLSSSDTVSARKSVGYLFKVADAILPER